MQSVRTAGQKRITSELSIEATTLIRFLFGLPFAFAYCFFLYSQSEVSAVQLESKFFLAGAGAGIAQIFATFLLVRALTIRNFAVGTALAKTEAIMTALLGALFFSASLSVLGYVSVVVGVAGVLAASQWRFSFRDLHENKSIKYGLGAGLGFALASLWIREASLSLGIAPLLSSSMVLLYMVALQTLICLGWVYLKEPMQFRRIWEQFRACWFIGFTGVAGSIGWFTAMSMQEAALVKTLGQLEFVVTLLITYLYFGERINVREYLGILLVAVSIGLLLIGA